MGRHIQTFHDHNLLIDQYFLFRFGWWLYEVLMVFFVYIQFNIDGRLDFNEYENVDVFMAHFSYAKRLFVGFNYISVSDITEIITRVRQSDEYEIFRFNRYLFLWYDIEL